MQMNNRLKIGIVILTVMVLGSFLLPFFNDVDPIKQGTYAKNLPPSLDHLLGTNSLGQDLFWWLVYAVRNSLILGISVSIFTITFAVISGTCFRICWRLV